MNVTQQLPIPPMTSATRGAMAGLGLFLLMVHVVLLPHTGLSLCLGSDGHVALSADHGCCHSPAETAADCPTRADFARQPSDTVAVSGNGCPDGLACSAACLDIPVNPAAARTVNDTDPHAKKLATAPEFWQQATDVIQTSSAELARIHGDPVADPMWRQLQTVVLLS